VFVCHKHSSGDNTAEIIAGHVSSSVSAAKMGHGCKTSTWTLFGFLREGLPCLLLGCISNGTLSVSASVSVRVNQNQNVDVTF